MTSELAVIAVIAPILLWSWCFSPHTSWYSSYIPHILYLVGSLVLFGSGVACPEAIYNCVHCLRSLR